MNRRRRNGDIEYWSGAVELRGGVVWLISGDARLISGVVSRVIYVILIHAKRVGHWLKERVGARVGIGVWIRIGGGILGMVSAGAWVGVSDRRRVRVVRYV